MRLDKIRLLAVLAALLPTGASGQRCKQMVFTGTVRSQDDYSRSIAPNLRFHLAPLKDGQGWKVSIGPKDSDEDWTYPVTFPLSGERQQLGTGYGTTVQEKMTYPTSLQFVLTHSDFVQYSKMAARPSEEFAKDVARLSKGQVTVTPLRYGRGDSKEAVKWMSFRVSLEVPLSFPSLDSSSTVRPCTAAK
jgi:hypothetical protein